MPIINFFFPQLDEIVYDSGFLFEFYSTSNKKDCMNCMNYSKKPLLIVRIYHINLVH